MKVKSMRMILLVFLFSLLVIYFSMDVVYALGGGGRGHRGSSPRGSGNGQKVTTPGDDSSSEAPPGDGRTGMLPGHGSPSENHGKGSTPAPVPEPSTIILFGTGLAGAVLYWKMKIRNRGRKRDS